MAATNPRQNFHTESEAGINKQINMELHASYVYQSMAFYYDRDDVALHGFYKFFKERSDCKYENAQNLMKYQNKRGGRIVLQDIKKADHDEWGPALDALETALMLEKNSNQAFLGLHKTADGHGDAQMADFLEGEFLSPAVESIKRVSDLLTNLKRAGTGLGEYIFDKKTLGGE